MAKRSSDVLSLSGSDLSDCETEVTGGRNVVKKARAKKRGPRSSKGGQKSTAVGRNSPEVSSPSRSRNRDDIPSSQEGTVSLNHRDISMIVAEVVKSLRESEKEEQERSCPPGE